VNSKHALSLLRITLRRADFNCQRKGQKTFAYRATVKYVADPNMLTSLSRQGAGRHWKSGQMAIAIGRRPFGSAVGGATLGLRLVALTGIKPWVFGSIETASGADRDTGEYKRT
jgi:hypothetical protein